MWFVIGSLIVLAFIMFPFAIPLCCLPEVFLESFIIRKPAKMVGQDDKFYFRAVITPGLSLDVSYLQIVISNIKINLR